MANLGDLLSQSEPPDPAAAQAWLERAVASGHPGAMTSMAKAVLRSDPKDVRAAFTWLQKAAAAGEPTAKGLMDGLADLHDARATDE